MNYLPLFSVSAILKFFRKFLKIFTTHGALLVYNTGAFEAVLRFASRIHLSFCFGSGSRCYSSFNGCKSTTTGRQTLNGPIWASAPQFRFSSVQWLFTALLGSTLNLPSSWILTLMQIWIRLLTLMRIQISGSCFSYWFRYESCLPRDPQHCFLKWDDTLKNYLCRFVTGKGSPERQRTSSETETDDGGEDQFDASIDTE